MIHSRMRGGCWLSLEPSLQGLQVSHFVHGDTLFILVLYSIWIVLFNRNNRSLLISGCCSHINNTDFIMKNTSDLVFVPSGKTHQEEPMNEENDDVQYLPLGFLLVFGTNGLVGGTTG